MGAPFCVPVLSGYLQAASWQNFLLHVLHIIRGSCPCSPSGTVHCCRRAPGYCWFCDAGWGLPGVPWPLSRSLLNLESWPQGVIGSMLPLGVLPLFRRVDSRGPSTGPAGASHSCSKAVVNVPLSPLTMATCNSYCQFSLARQCGALSQHTRHCQMLLHCALSQQGVDGGLLNGGLSMTGKDGV